MSDSVVMTVESHEALKREIERLETEGRREIADRIKTAREFGDLKENAEYHDAKNSQALLETKILTLRDKLLRAEVQETAPAADVVALGTTVTLRDEGSGREDTFTLVSALDAAPSDGKLSFDSPLARALVGAKAGKLVDVPTPRGVRKVTVLSLA
ncbi:MAG TPA: transcription elongation factor GreA [Thermoleophilaceae bacterium]|nr:transcription elongation factor GreA [Thermoleophilaceae bacterium]